MQHAQAYQLLKQNLENTTGWQAWQSDWQNSQLGIEHPQQQRRIQLQTQDNTNQENNTQQEHPQLQATLEQTADANDNKYPTLTLSLPSLLEASHQGEIASLLHAWALQLYPIKKMQKLLDEETDKPKNKAPTENPQTQGDNHA